ncbi:hypothetical protein SDC9_159139 [bioreactor metagenome]|uniref:Uncharacterized protein n=1 Tax=bioreactor metagenome TaxID=1076179 RepID=A0A645FBZ2_9ZZZZ
MKDFFKKSLEETKNKITAPEAPVQEQLKANFSSQTGEKLHEECPQCWMKDNKVYNCGFEKCPGFNLPYLEKSKI